MAGDEAELAFVATMRDEASKYAAQVRRNIDAATGTTKPIETPVRVRDEVSARIAAMSGNLDSFGRKAQTTGRDLTRYLTLPLVGVAGASVGLEASYDKTMRQVAIATDGPIDKLSELAKTLGADTQFSAGEAADAMLELAKSGMSAATIQGGALEQTMTLAAAGGISLADAATAVANGLAVYKLDASDAERVTTSLAGAANASSASVDSLTQGMAQSALAAKNTGLSIEETAGALSLFDANGLKGSDAGTSFKTMLQNLLPQTENAWGLMDQLNLSFVDAHGNFNDLGTVAQKLHDKLGPLTQAQRKQYLQTLFGSDAFRAASILTDGGRKAVEKYTKAAKDQETTQKLANAAMEGTSGAVEAAKGSLETAGLTIGEVLAPYVQDLADDVADAANWFGELDGGTQDVIVTIGALVAALGPAAVGLGAVARGASSVLDFVSKLTPQVEAGTGGFARYGRAAKIAAGGAGLAALYASTQTTDEGTATLLGTMGGAAAGFAIGGPVGAAVGALGGYITATGQAEESQLDLKAAQQAVVDTLNEQTGAFTKRSRAQFLSDAGDAGLLATAKELNIDIPRLTDNAFKGAGALGRMQAAALAAAPDESRADIVDLFTQIGKLSDAQFAGQRGWLLEAEGMRKGSEAARQARQNVNELVSQYGYVPKTARTIVEAVGAAKTKKEAREIIRQYQSIPENRRTIMKLLGVEKVKSDAKSTTKALEDTADAKPDGKPFVNQVRQMLRQALKEGQTGSEAVSKAIEKPIERTHGDVGSFARDVIGGLNRTKGEAGAAGHAVGQAIQTNTMGPVNAIAALAAQAVRNAITQARAAAGGAGGGKGGGGGKGNGRRAGVGAGVPGEADTMVLDLLNERGGSDKGGKGAAGKYGRDLIESLIRGFEGGADKLDEMLGKAEDRITHHYDQLDKQDEAAIRKRYKGQKDAADKIRKALDEAEDQNDRRRRRALKRLRAESADLKQAAKDRAAIVDQLNQALAKIDPQQFIDAGNSFRDAMRDAASLINFDPINDAPITADFLQQHLAAQLAQITSFTQNLAALRGRVSDTILKQLEDAGYENGAAYAAALAQATPDQLAAINATQSQIDAATQAAGTEMADHWHDAAVAASAGLIAGLESQLANVDAVGRKLARKLRRAILDELGIKSPSRVLRADFRKGIEGVGLGIEDGTSDAVRAAQSLSNRVAAAAQVDATQLGIQAASTAGVSAVVAQTVTIRHEVVSPDGSVSTMTADEIASIIARDPNSARVIERALRPQRVRRNTQTIGASESLA